MSTNQQRADILLREHQENRRRKMTLFEWDVAVRPHLHFIQAGASMVARHASMLPCKPYFETLAEDELAKSRAVLEAALQNIIAAQAIYENKILEREHAA